MTLIIGAGNKPERALTPEELIAKKAVIQLKIAGEVIKDDDFATAILASVIKEAMMQGGSGRTFIGGYNSALTQVADMIGWGDEAAKKLRNQILDMKMRPPAKEE